MGKAVFRWQWRPGSTLYVAWTQQRFNQDYAGEFNFGRDARALLSSPADDVFLVKLSVLARAIGVDPGPRKMHRVSSHVDKLRWQSLYDALAARILVLDGAMGTMLQARRPTTTDYGGPGLDGCNENLCRTHSDWILDIHRAYLDAGADIVETNSFQGSSIVLADFGLEQHSHKLNVAAARLARQAADEFSTASKPRFVAGSIGPTTKSLTLRGDVTFGELRDSCYDQAKALVEGGVDLLLFETAFDTRSLRAGLSPYRSSSAILTSGSR